jgi:hypothetical protein
MMTPSKNWREDPAPDEDDRFAKLAKRFVALQGLNAKRGPGRALHRKHHHGYVASLEVFANVPDHARHGLFARAATYEALVRFSNGSHASQADAIDDVRGIAVKVLGVTGPKVLGEASTQDFLAVLGSSTPFRTADEFVATVWASRSKPLAPFRLIGSLGFRRAVTILRQLVAGLKGPRRSLTTRSFYSALPIQCGPYAARFAFVPQSVGDHTVPSGRDFYADDLAARLREGPLRYDLAMQFFVDEGRTPIEDGSVDWAEAVSPYTPVATLVIDRQDVTSARGKAITERIERLSFDPWHALVEHKPLGNLMRARRHAYFASTRGRSALAEPTTIAALLDGAS